VRSWISRRGREDRLQANHKPTAEYVRQLRLALHQKFGRRVIFLPADIDPYDQLWITAPFDFNPPARSGGYKSPVNLRKRFGTTGASMFVSTAALQRLQFTVIDQSRRVDLRKGMSRFGVVKFKRKRPNGASYWLDTETGVQTW